MNKIKVLLVEDDPVWRDCLSAYIIREHDLLLIGSAGNKEEAIFLFQQNEVDVVLMDIVLTANQYDGIDAAIEILTLKPVKIIMLTSIDENEIIIDSFTIGAVNYITKAYYKEIPFAIRSAFQNHSSVHPDIAAVLRTEFNRMKREELKRLMTPTEKNILALMEKGLTKTQIKQILHVTENTIKTHVHRIVKKFGVKSGREAAEKAKRRGLL